MLRPALRVLALLAPLACASAQALPQQEPQQPQAPSELPVVAAAVGDEIVKFAELIGLVQREMAAGKIKDFASADRRMAELQDETIAQRLKVQAGQDMGFDPKLVENFVERVIEDNTERLGGPVAASEFLEQNGVRPSQWRGVTENEIYANQWELAITGRGPGAGGRPVVDRYIRPGELHAYYRSILVSRNPEDRALVGEERERVVLQELILPIDGNEGEVVAQAEGLLTAVEQGADFSDLVRRYGVGQGNDGIRRPQVVEALRAFSDQRHGSPELYLFASEGKKNQISRPLVGRSPTGQSAVVIYRLVERMEAVGPQPFLDFELQDRLRDELQDRIDASREAVALQRVARSAYIWPRDSWTAKSADPVLRGIDF